MRNFVLLVAIVLISFSAFASGEWDYDRNEQFFKNLIQCQNQCSDLCDAELDLAKDILSEYERVCLQGDEVNYDFFHYCGYQCTRVCRIQTQAIMKTSLMLNTKICN